MSVAQEAFRDAAISAGLLLALPLGYCAAVIIRALCREVKTRCCGKQN